MMSPEILIVDDDLGVRTLLCALLERVGYTVEVAADGRCAIERMRRKCYAAVLLDLMLPGANGFEIIRLIKSDRPHVLKRIIVLTAAANRTLENFADERAIFSVIRKPFDIADLLAQVTTCVAQHEYQSKREA